MEVVNRRFHDVGIATEWMTFTGHPGETLTEALETVDWIERERDAVDLFIVGEFGLQAGSPIAQAPAAFGVTNIRLAEGDDLGLYPLYDEIGDPLTKREKEELNRAVERISAAYTLRAYPWAGAVSTHHSLLWFIRHGTGVFRRPGTAARGPRLAPRP
jgi:anaerobic magnesium-protoporphyrin IX monomethyl ester cyclase